MKLHHWSTFFAITTLFAAPVAWAHHPHEVNRLARVSPDFATDQLLFATIEGTFDLLLRSTDGGDRWSPAHEGLRARAVTELQFSPDFANDGIVYVGDDRAGVDISYDRGETWNPTTINVGGVTAIGLSPLYATDPLLFAGTSRGLVRSVDAGFTVTLVYDTLAYANPLEFVFSPNFSGDQTMFSASGVDGVLVSTDRGLSWDVAGVGLAGTDVRDIARGPDGESYFLVAATWGGGLFLSTDQGASWAPAPIPDGDPNLTAVAVSPNFDVDGTVYVTSQTGGVYVTRDFGTTWEVEDLGFIPLTGQTDTHWRGVEFSPNYATDALVFVSMFEGLYISRPDPFDEWYSPRLLPTRIGRRVKLSPQFPDDLTIVATGYGFEPLVSRDAGVSWEVRNIGSLSVSNYSLALSPDFIHDETIFSGTGWGVEVSTDMGTSWHAGYFPPGPTGATKSIQFSPEWPADSTLFAANWHSVVKSTSGGVRWTTSLDLPQRAYDMVISPDYPQDPTLWLTMSNAMMRTTDDGQTWTQIGLGALGAGMRQVEVSPNFAVDSTLFVGYVATGIKRSTNGGRTWVDLSHALPDLSITKMAISGTYATDQTIAVSTHGAGIVVSTDGGDTWQRRWPFQLEGGFTESLDVSKHFAQDSTMIAGTYGGFYLTRDAGTTWQLVTNVERYEDSRQDTAMLRPDGEPRAMLSGGLTGDQIHQAKAGAAPPAWASFAGIQSFTESSQTFGLEPGETATFRFHGTGVRWIGYRGPDAGEALWSIDGGLVSSINLRQPERELQAVVLEITGLEERLHRLDLTIGLVPEAENRWDQVVAIDAFDVFYGEARSGRRR